MIDQFRRFGNTASRVTPSLHHRSWSARSACLVQEAECCGCRCVIDKLPPRHQGRIQHMLYLLRCLGFFLLHSPDKASMTRPTQRRIQHTLDLSHYYLFCLLHNPRAAANLHLHAVLARYCYAYHPVEVFLARYCYANHPVRALLATGNRGHPGQAWAHTEATQELPRNRAYTEAVQDQS
jgi:hypothetical protein